MSNAGAATASGAGLGDLISSKAARASYEGMYDLYALWCELQVTEVDMRPSVASDTKTIAVGAQ